MLTAVGKGWLFRRYEILEGDELLAELELRSFRDRMRIRAGDEEWSVPCSGWFKRSFVLEDGRGKTLASAEKPNPFLRRLGLRFEDLSYVLEAAAPLRRAYVLRAAGREIGSIAPQGFRARRIQADLPAQFPLAVRAFVIGLVVAEWRRAARRHAA